jgi:hypothetical protein
VIKFVIDLRQVGSQPYVIKFVSDLRQVGSCFVGEIKAKELENIGSPIKTFDLKQTSSGFPPSIVGYLTALIL